MKMKRRLRGFTSWKKSTCYGLGYMALIPIYALLYTCVLPESSLELNQHNPGFVSNLYFSVITITTLGFGDITPIGKFAQILTASEAFFGILLVGLFLNSLSHQHGIKVQENEKQMQERRNKEQAIERFSAFNQLIDLKIKRYIRYSIPIITPPGAKDTDSINENFHFNDLQYLFEPAFKMNDHFFTPAISYYYKNLKELADSLEELVKFGYTQRWIDIENLCLNFINTSKELDSSSYILNQPNTRVGNKKGSDVDVELIKKHQGEVEFLESNTLNPYISLYFLIHESIVFIKKYRQMASEIIEGKEN